MYCNYFGKVPKIPHLQQAFVSCLVLLPNAHTSGPHISDVNRCVTLVSNSIISDKFGIELLNITVSLLYFCYYCRYTHSQRKWTLFSWPSRGRLNKCPTPERRPAVSVILLPIKMSNSLLSTIVTSI
jgi:hypothetical protein